MLTVQGEVTLSMIFKDNIEGFKQKIECKKSRRRAPVAKPWLQVSFLFIDFVESPGNLRCPRVHAGTACATILPPFPYIHSMV